jgi:hypothetical protein
MPENPATDGETRTATGTHFFEFVREPGMTVVQVRHLAN